jgi:hypothetical protein
VVGSYVMERSNVSTHYADCIVCGKRVMCSSDTHALGCGACCGDTGQRIEFCSLECFEDLERIMIERKRVYKENIG